MHPVLQYFLMCLGAGLIGIISGALMFWIGSLLHRRRGIRIEMTFVMAGGLGMAMLLAGQALNIPTLAAASVLLWGWLVLPILLIVPFLMWRFFTRRRQKNHELSPQRGDGL